MHQGSVLSPLLFILVLVVLSREFKVGLPAELLNADDLVLVPQKQFKELLLGKSGNKRWACCMVGQRS